MSHIHTIDAIRLVVFDMAGTTIEDRGLVPRAFTEALRTQGIEVTPEELQTVRGASKREAIGLLIEERFGKYLPDTSIRIEQTYMTFRDNLQTRYSAEGVRFIPGTPETFAWLQSRGIRIAINTGFDRVITETILTNLDWQDATVDAVICGDDVSQGRPAPFLIFRAMEKTRVLSVHQVMNVGDTLRDLEAGFNAGVRFNVGVFSGAHHEDLLRKVTHTYILPSVADLPDLWELVL